MTTTATPREVESTLRAAGETSTLNMDAANQFIDRLPDNKSGEEGALKKCCRVYCKIRAKFYAALFGLISIIPTLVYALENYAGIELSDLLPGVNLDLIGGLLFSWAAAGYLFYNNQSKNKAKELLSTTQTGQRILQIKQHIDSVRKEIDKARASPKPVTQEALLRQGVTPRPSAPGVTRPQPPRPQAPQGFRPDSGPFSATNRSPPGPGYPPDPNGICVCPRCGNTDGYRRVTVQPGTTLLVSAAAKGAGFNKTVSKTGSQIPITSYTYCSNCA